MVKQENLVSIGLHLKKKKRKKFLQKYSEWYVILNLTKYHPCSVVELKTEIE